MGSMKDRLLVPFRGTERWAAVMATGLAGFFSLVGLAAVWVKWNQPVVAFKVLASIVVVPAVFVVAWLVCVFFVPYLGPIPFITDRRRRE